MSATNRSMYTIFSALWIWYSIHSIQSLFIQRKTSINYRRNFKSFKFNSTNCDAFWLISINVGNWERKKFHGNNQCIEIWLVYLACNELQKCFNILKIGNRNNISILSIEFLLSIIKVKISWPCSSF